MSSPNQPLTQIFWAGALLSIITTNFFIHISSSAGAEGVAHAPEQSSVQGYHEPYVVHGEPGIVRLIFAGPERIELPTTILEIVIIPFNYGPKFWRNVIPFSLPTFTH